MYSTPILTRPVWRPHVRFDEVDVPFFRKLYNYGPCVLARHPVEVSICDDGILLGYQAVFQDDLTVVA